MTSPTPSPESPSADYSSALAPGSMLSTYRIEAVLGQGGFGVTYLAYDSVEERQVVIKENLPKDYAFREPSSSRVHVHGKAEDFAWAMKNFVAEARLLAELDHPHIVKVHRAFETNNTAYYVMDHVGGQSLEQCDQQRSSTPRWSETELCDLLITLLGAIDYLHSNKIQHRDLKPDNILIDEQGTPYIIDFGTAKQMYAQHTQTVIESAGYTPIEQIYSQSNTGPWSDIYALGGSIYRLMTGERPAQSGARAVVDQDPVVPLSQREDMTHYSLPFRESIDRAMAVRHTARWQSATEWQAALQKQREKEQARAAAAASPARRILWLWVVATVIGWMLVLLLLIITMSDKLIIITRNNQKASVQRMRESNLEEERIRLGPSRTDLVDCFNEALRAEEAGNYAEALRLYKQAAAQGHAGAQNNLATLYNNAQGVEQSYDLALKWYERAALRDNGFAMLNLGKVYHYGRGVSVDKQKAKEWYKKCLQTTDPSDQKAREGAAKDLKLLED